MAESELLQNMLYMRELANSDMMDFITIFCTFTVMAHFFGTTLGRGMRYRGSWVALIEFGCRPEETPEHALASTIWVNNAPGSGKSIGNTKASIGTIMTCCHKPLTSREIKNAKNGYG